MEFRKKIAKNHEAENIVGRFTMMCNSCGITECYENNRIEVNNNSGGNERLISYLGVVGKAVNSPG